MSTAELHLVEGGGEIDDAMNALIAAARDMHEHEQIDHWRLGDHAVAVARQRAPVALEEEHDRDDRAHVNTGHYRLLDEVARKLEKTAPTITMNVVRQCFDTARAWPADERMPDKASFHAHRMFNANRFHGVRGERLRRLLRESKANYVTMEMARLKASESLPSPAFTTVLDKTESQLASTLRRIWNPVDRVGPDDRKNVGLIMRRLAADFETGEFR